MSEFRNLSIAAMILAAGEGRRFGGAKALARIGGATFLETIARNLRDVATDIVVVGGASFDRVEKEAMRLGVRAAFNPNWPKGQFTSLKAGLDTLVDGMAAIFIVLVDHPLVKSETYGMLHDRFIINPDKILIPVFGGRRGHPLLIPSGLRIEILHAPENSNMREILKNHSSDIVEVYVDDPGILRDIDTPRDLEEEQHP